MLKDRFWIRIFSHITLSDTKIVCLHQLAHSNFHRHQIQMLFILGHIQIQDTCKWLWVHIWRHHLQYTKVLIHTFCHKVSRKLLTKLFDCNSSIITHICIHNNTNHVIKWEEIGKDKFRDNILFVFMQQVCSVERIFSQAVDVQPTLHLVLEWMWMLYATVVEGKPEQFSVTHNSLDLRNALKIRGIRKPNLFPIFNYGA